MCLVEELSCVKMPDPLLEFVTHRLASMPGVVAIVLGGSRARGTEKAGSDTDIGLYFRSEIPLDTSRLLETVKALVDEPDEAVVTPVGGWGPWIVGGGWLSIRGRKVDLLYRNLEDVARVMRDCQNGRVTMDYQPGHPHGFCSATWMGEIALCQPLHDPEGVIAELKAMTVPYPEPLQTALIGRFLWEALFSIENGETAMPRNEQTHIAGCAYRALCCIAQVLFAMNGRYLINEKGALDEAASFPLAIDKMRERVANVWMEIGRSHYPVSFHELRRMDRELKALLASS
jgi:predicted nucleotidyltransferase